jgi:hypothetical protein
MVLSRTSRHTIKSLIYKKHEYTKAHQVLAGTVYNCRHYNSLHSDKSKCTAKIVLDKDSKVVNEKGEHTVHCQVKP